MAAGWLVPDRDSDAGADAAAAVRKLMQQLIPGTIYHQTSNSGYCGGSVESRSGNGMVGSGADEDPNMPVSPEELTALVASADR